MQFPDVMTPADQIPGSFLAKLLEGVAVYAIERGRTITLVGWVHRHNAPLLCIAGCHFDHQGTYSIIPDLVVINMMANEQSLSNRGELPTFTRSDGRAAYILPGQNTRDPDIKDEL